MSIDLMLCQNSISCSVFISLIFIISDIINGFIFQFFRFHGNSERLSRRIAGHLKSIIFPNLVSVTKDCRQQYLILKQQFKSQPKMHNKQNMASQKENPSVYHTHKPKSNHRYPLNDMDSNFNSIQVSCPQQKFGNKFNFNLNSNNGVKHSFSGHQILNVNRSEVSLEIKQRFKIMHFNSVHELIANAREKKSEIEDLLRKEELKAEMEDLQEKEVMASLRKLKKVVRLMEIVCKIILGRNQQNGYIDLVSQQDITMREMQSFSMDNFEREINSKNNQIIRLKKLVQILSVPSKSATSRLDQSNSSLNMSVNNSRCINVITFNKWTQTEQLQLQNASEAPQKSGRLLSIIQEYSLWNILDGSTSLLHQKQTRPASRSSFSLLKIHPIRVEAKSTALKRFKSIVKIVLNAINLCVHVFSKYKQGEASQINSITESIQKISNHFNEKYHEQNGYFNDTFCKEIRDKIIEAYDQVETLYSKNNPCIKFEEIE